jgi:hypothetical protein|tara:strand:- start:747 stop:1091 length:345 start_codon:yes stop_codon:yes gene_type:complete
MPPRHGCRLAVDNKAFLHKTQFVIIRPIPAETTFSGEKNFNLGALDNAGLKFGLTIAANSNSVGRHRRLTFLDAIVEHGLAKRAHRRTLMSSLPSADWFLGTVAIMQIGSARHW